MFSRIKELLQGEKMGFLIIEDGEPTYVVLPIEDFKRLKDKREEVCTCAPEKDVVLEDVVDVAREDIFDWAPSPKTEEERTEEAFGVSPENSGANFEIPEEFLMDVEDKQEEREQEKDEVRIEDLPF